MNTGLTTISCGNTKRYTGRLSPRCWGGRGCPACRRKWTAYVQKVKK